MCSCQYSIKCHTGVAKLVRAGAVEEVYDCSGVGVATQWLIMFPVQSMEKNFYLFFNCQEAAHIAAH